MSMMQGTVLRVKSIVVIADGSDPDSAKVTIKNSDGDTVVDDQDMTNDGSGVFTYIYQSATDGVSGIYSVLCTVVKGSYTARKRDIFELFPESET